MKTKGTRVLAIRDANANEINIYGYGEYVGDEPCPICFNMSNPKIVLDSGDIVWGCECWWGEASVVEKKFAINTGSREVNVVRVEREVS